MYILYEFIRTARKVGTHSSPLILDSINCI